MHNKKTSIIYIIFKNNLNYPRLLYGLYCNTLLKIAIEIQQTREYQYNLLFLTLWK